MPFIIYQGFVDKQISMIYNKEIYFSSIKISPFVNYTISITSTNKPDDNLLVILWLIHSMVGISIVDWYFNPDGGQNLNKFALSGLLKNCV